MRFLWQKSPHTFQYKIFSRHLPEICACALCEKKTRTETRASDTSLYFYSLIISIANVNQRFSDTSFSIARAFKLSIARAFKISGAKLIAVAAFGE